MITRAVGTDPDVDVDGFTIEAEEGDVFLICSDGLSDMVEDEEILELVHANRDDLDKAVKALVAAANRGGGEDNITAVAFRISSEAAPNLEDTVAMPALTGDEDEPDEQTREYARTDAAGDTMVVPPGEFAGASPRERGRASSRPPTRGGSRIVLIGSPCWRSRRRCSSGGCRADSPQPRARRTPHGRRPDGDRLRHRLHRAQVADLGRLARLRSLLLRPLPRRARRRAR